MNKISIKTGSWCGDKTVTLSIPTNWQTTTFTGNPPSTISSQEIKKKLLQPINSPSLIKLANNRKNAVIVIDDIMRPTPTSKVLPIVIDQLKKGGINKKNITIVIASGSHQKASIKDIELKVGKTLSKEIKVVAHNDEAKDLVFLGKTKLGSPIYANKVVLNSDLKISIGGIYPHPIAGFSGGAKTFVPGICGLKTISHIHAALKPSNYEGELNNQFRQELTTIAKKIGLEFVINVVLTPTREIGNIFAGEMVEAHKKGVEALKKYYAVSSPKNSDVVISNTYPYDGSYYFFSRGFWPLTSGKNKNARIEIVNGSMTKNQYSFKSLPQSKLEYFHQVFFSLLFVVSGWYKPNLLLARLNRLLFLRKPEFYLYYTGQANKKELQTQFPYAAIFDNWDNLLEVVQKKQSKRDIRVAIYPYASLQIPIEKQ